MLAINEPSLVPRAEIIWEKGTNRAEFFRGEVNKYGWVDIGSSFLPSETTAAFLFAQLENLETIQSKRKILWDAYQSELMPLELRGEIKLPEIPGFASNNAHMFYIVCKTLEERSNLIEFLKKNEIMSVFHYLSLHSSPYYSSKHDGRSLPNSDFYTNTLLRLPLYFELELDDVKRIANLISQFYQ
jgi:dTDP-4-amino-4,6-dideoxygalactose transaminase